MTEPVWDVHCVQHLYQTSLTCWIWGLSRLGSHIISHPPHRAGLVWVLHSVHASNQPHTQRKAPACTACSMWGCYGAEAACGTWTRLALLAESTPSPNQVHRQALYTRSSMQGQSSVDAACSPYPRQVLCVGLGPGLVHAVYGMCGWTWYICCKVNTAGPGHVLHETLTADDPCRVDLENGTSLWPDTARRPDLNPSPGPLKQHPCLNVNSAYCIAVTLNDHLR